MAIRLEVWGDYALFTRPEMKIERVSYDVMTPSAARGIIEAIYWHPGIRWVIDRITVVNPIVFTNIRRNEVSVKASASNLMNYVNNGGELPQIKPSQNVCQRASMLLKNVRYIIEAHFEMTERAAPSDNEGKFQDIVTRRIAKGQCYHQPCFGCREFPVSFKAAEGKPVVDSSLNGEHDFGFMLYDIDYSNQRDLKPMFFRAKMRDGVIDIPKIGSKEVIY